MGPIRDRRWLWPIAAILLLLAGWALWSGPAEDRFDHGPRSLLKKRPAQFNRARVAELSLLLNGQPFAGRHHVVAQGGEVHFTGHLLCVPSAIPAGAWQSLEVSLRPASLKRTDENWDVDGLEKYWEWGFSPLGEERKIDVTYRVSDRHFAPGEYNARLYLLVDDYELGNNTVDLLETATFTILPPDQ